MSAHSPFDHLPDPEVGAALREILTPGDDPAFIGRVMARVRSAPTWWEVLDAWSRPGLAAALLLVALGGFLLGLRLRSGDAGLAFDEPVQAVAEGVGVAGLFSAPTPPNVDVVLAVGMGQ